jgi:hypothetical protein
MMHCRMCSQRLTRPGKLCRECERELARARQAAASVDGAATAMPDIEPDRLMPASALAAWQRRGVRVPLVVAAFVLGIGATAGVYTMERTAGAGESVMLDRDVTRVQPRVMPSRATRSEHEGDEPRAAARAVNVVPAVQVREAPKRRLVAVTSQPASEEPARFDRVLALSDALAQCAPEPFFSRLACEQRARTRYCDGAAGRLPQCPEEFPRDHGQ